MDGQVVRGVASGAIEPGFDPSSALEIFSLLGSKVMKKLKTGQTKLFWSQGNWIEIKNGK